MSRNFREDSFRNSRSVRIPDIIIDAAKRTKRSNTLGALRGKVANYSNTIQEALKTGTRTISFHNIQTDRNLFHAGCRVMEGARTPADSTTAQASIVIVTSLCAKFSMAHLRQLVVKISLPVSGDYTL